MSASEFEGNVSVSTARQVFRGLELGRPGFVKKAVVDDVHQIDRGGEIPGRSNSRILFGKFPEEAAVKGLVHDAAVNLYARELEFRDLREPSEQEILDILEGSVKGTSEATPELRHRVNELEKNYGISPDELLGYGFDSGETVSELLEEVARQRYREWREDTEGFTGVDVEEPVFRNSMSGRIDLLYSGSADAPDQVREVKTSREPDRFDEFQIAAYWLMKGDGDAEAVIDYPLADERLEFDPDGDASDFEPEEYRFDVTRSRDIAMNAINELKRLQNEYFQAYGSDTAKKREKATREALRDMEVL